MGLSALTSYRDDLVLTCAAKQAGTLMAVQVGFEHAISLLKAEVHRGLGMMSCKEVTEVRQARADRVLIDLPLMGCRSR